MRNHGWNKGCKYTITIHPSIHPSMWINRPHRYFCTREWEAHAMQLQSPPTCEGRPLLWKRKNSSRNRAPKMSHLILSGFGIALVRYLHGFMATTTTTIKVMCVFFLHIFFVVRYWTLEASWLATWELWQEKLPLLSIKFPEGHHPVDNKGGEWNDLTFTNTRGEVKKGSNRTWYNLERCK